MASDANYLLLKSGSVASRGSGSNLKLLIRGTSLTCACCQNTCSSNMCKALSWTIQAYPSYQACSAGKWHGFDGRGDLNVSFMWARGVVVPCKKSGKLVESLPKSMSASSTITADKWSGAQPSIANTYRTLKWKSSSHDKKTLSPCSTYIEYWLNSGSYPGSIGITGTCPATGNITLYLNAEVGDRCLAGGHPQTTISWNIIASNDITKISTNLGTVRGTDRTPWIMTTTGAGSSENGALTFTVDLNDQ